MLWFMAGGWLWRRLGSRHALLFASSHLVVEFGAASKLVRGKPGRRVIVHPA